MYPIYGGMGAMMQKTCFIQLRVSVPHFLLVRAGAIPEALGALTKLEVCVLYNNNLSGTPATAVVVFVRLISPGTKSPVKLIVGRVGE